MSKDDVLRRRYEAELDAFADDALSRIEHHQTKVVESRRKLICAVVVAEMQYGGYDTKAFWDRKDIVGKSTFNRYKKNDDVFSDVLKTVRRMWRDFKLHMAKLESESAFVAIQLASLEMTEVMIGLAKNAESETVQRQAASDLLDRTPATSKIARQQITGADGGPLQTQEVVEGISSEDERDARLLQALQRVSQRVQS